jgi:acyl carrier protein
MEPTDTLKTAVKQLLVANLMLQVTEAQIGDELPLFGPGGLGLDSVDALQIVVALDKQYGLKIADPAVAREILQSVSTIAAALARHQQPAAA